MPPVELPEFEPLEHVHAGRGVASNHYLLDTYQKTLEGYFRMWHHHFEFLLLGYGAYMTFFAFCKKAFPPQPTPPPPPTVPTNAPPGVTNGLRIGLDLNLVTGKGGNGTMTFDDLPVNLVASGKFVYMKAGTKFWTHRVSGEREGLTVADTDGHDLSLWECWSEVGAAFNRCVVFASTLFHSRALLENYGTGTEARLIQVAFGTE